MSALDSIHRLRAIAARLLKREDPDAAWFSAVLQEYVTGAAQGVTLGQAFGFARDGRSTPWWELEAAEQRTRLLLDIRERHFPRLSANAAAARISAASERYRLGRFRVHSKFMIPPDGIDDLARDLFELLRLGLPIGESTVRTALANRSARSVGSGEVSNLHETDEATNGDTDETTEIPGGNRPAAA